MVRRVQIGAIKARTDRTNPSVWRKGKPKTSRRINAVSIATSENRFCPPGRPEGDGRHASVAAAESHRVTSPRWTSARSYSRQFPTRYVVLYFGCTFDFISRIVRWPRPQDQPVDDARRSKGQEPCTKATKSWRVDETYVRVKGRWCYLYRAIDSSGATIDFVLSRWRDAATATRLFRKALPDPSHPQPRVINTDQARLYGSAIAGVKKAGILRRRCRHRPVQYVNNIVEPNHRAIKRRVTAKQGFRAFHAARRTIQGSEAMHMIRKGQARWVSGSDGRRQIQFINKLFGVVA